MNLYKELKELLYREIPISKSMGIDVESYDDKSLCLFAPLDKNINHKMTAFGGSLYSVAVLSGWSLLYLVLKENELSGHIVIHESRVLYSRPVTGPIVACSRFDSDANLKRAISLYEKKGRCRVNITVLVEQDGMEAFRLEGRYVVHR
ncbi:MAG: YiiD C-terminal domain-containing protein [Gammaproteobacteria bacterium]|nr:YiiD C-terminal domain-containing protein [Gammaproteobacteria bacterium]